MEYVHAPTLWDWYMLAKLGLVANLYWLSSQFDVEPTQGDKLNGITCTAEGGGGSWCGNISPVWLFMCVLRGLWDQKSDGFAGEGLCLAENIITVTLCEWQDIDWPDKKNRSEEKGSAWLHPSFVLRLRGGGPGRSGPAGSSGPGPAHTLCHAAQEKPWEERRGFQV